MNPLYFKALKDFVTFYDSKEYNYKQGDLVLMDRPLGIWIFDKVGAENMQILTEEEWVIAKAETYKKVAVKPELVKEEKPQIKKVVKKTNKK